MLIVSQEWFTISPHSITFFFLTSITYSKDAQATDVSSSGLPSELKNNMIDSFLAIFPEMHHKYFKITTYVAKSYLIAMMLKLGLISWAQEIHLILPPE